MGYDSKYGNMKEDDILDIIVVFNGSEREHVYSNVYYGSIQISSGSFVFECGDMFICLSPHTYNSVKLKKK